MLSKRPAGEVQPGVKWGPFTMRIPLIHLRFLMAEMLQGLVVAGASGLALVPYLMALLGLSFEEAVVMAMFHSMIISFSWMFFGDPYAPGWLTPAIPFVVAFVTAPAFIGDHTAQFQAMTALSLNFAFILIVLGITGLGEKLIKVVPNVFKGGIILGAAVSAFLRVTKDGDAANVFQSAPIASTLGVFVCLVFAFSKPLHTLAFRNPRLAKMLGFGLLPGFAMAGIIGFFTGEFEYNIRWELLDVAGASMSLWSKASPFAIGWPPVGTFLASFPLALITYILFFGDVITGNELIEEAQKSRTDEKLEIDSSRAHIATGIRNVLMGIAAPFFATQGVLWTGIQVILLQRWSKGREKVDSIFDSIGSFYLFGLPLLFIFLPLVTLLQPLLPLALAVTLILTAFACATLALSLVEDATERGAMLITAMAFSVFEPWLGLLVGLITVTALCGINVFEPDEES